jgi:hypothetical protein
MSLEAELRTYTLADGTVTALVGTRMHARMLPQTPTLPAIVFQRIDTRRTHDMDGPDGLPRPRMQVTSWATTPAGVTDLATAVRDRLDGYRGVWGAVTVGSCLLVGERDLNDPDASRFAVAQDYMIQYQEV